MGKEILSGGGLWQLIQSNEVMILISYKSVATHVAHFSSLCGRAVGPHGQPFTFPVTIAVPVSWNWGTCLGWRGRWRRVQCLSAKQCSRAMELTEVTECNQGIHLKERKVVFKVLSYIYEEVVHNIRSISNITLALSGKVQEIIADSLTFSKQSESTNVWCSKPLHERTFTGRYFQNAVPQKAASLKSNINRSRFFIYPDFNQPRF